MGESLQTDSGSTPDEPRAEGRVAHASTFQSHAVPASSPQPVEESGIRQRAARRADPVLGTPEFSRGHGVAADAVHQPLVHFTYEAQTDREVFQPRETMLQGANVVRHFFDILDRRLGGRGSFKEKEIRKTGLCSLYST